MMPVLPKLTLKEERQELVKKWQFPLKKNRVTCKQNNHFLVLFLVCQL